VPHGVGPRRIAARLLLDHPLQHAGDEGHAGGFHRLQVARRKQPWQRRIARIVGRIAKHIGERSHARQRIRAADLVRDTRPVQKLAGARRNCGGVEQAVAVDAHEHRPLHGRYPRAADQKRARRVGRQRGAGSQV
jgi:hypothetical protein